ncbi:hypothetical protein GQ57_03140 [Burkholderia sp. MSh2]|uniref:Uncharacterized protein n=1 Tax=Burkholderia paludis TaxID=1506587 RepID=A0A6J5DX52_9BURK|nr:MULTISPECIES: hypothetical protein [Burkholderia]KEZ07186.1 hypothetical protein GQ57_03140 [Burkholderia sp. MSh2]CAB3758563.1 hypothetical protein LMG30113_03209 [Burkholderia paludis]VWB73075.1 hypothetical protein BPA30113_03304 [Burkholderia paludis]
MDTNRKHDNGTIGAMDRADHRADTRGLTMGPPRYRSDLTDGERADAHAAIDNAMLSVGQVLEAALQAMANLRDARATLQQCGDARDPRISLGGRQQSS